MLITNAVLVNEGRRYTADLLIRGERIEKIAPQITAPANTEVIDAKGRLLLPGMIDDQVHFREPGLTHKGDLATESAAAVAGGITSFMDMPNVNPQTITRAALAAKYQLAAGRAYANYAFYMGTTNDNLAELEALQRGEACAIKIFMGASTGNMLVDDPVILEKIFERAPTLIVTHCEDTPLIKINEDAAREKYGDNVPFSEHPYIRSAEACWKSTELAVGLAKRHGTRLHVLHLTTARELEFFQPGPIAGKQITVEACVHHLYFDESRYADLGAKLKCNPAVKTRNDREALIAAVTEGRIDIIATDHAPHTREEKNASYFKAPSGLPLVQHALLALLELVEHGELSLETVVQRACHAPAQRFGVLNRGFLREGAYADLVLIDPDAETVVTPESLRSKCAWSPFDGHSFGSRIDATWVNGQLVYRDGTLRAQALGQRLAFA
ncbi:MAG: dihydroorotase [Nevskia sp.]|jgi:dihydroorotase|nr:dihydroorotase [Nevskia sp.]